MCMTKRQHLQEEAEEVREWSKNKRSKEAMRDNSYLLEKILVDFEKSGSF